MSLDAQMKADALKEELGAYYSTYLRLKEMQDMDPVQARMEQIVIYWDKQPMALICRHGFK